MSDRGFSLRDQIAAALTDEVLRWALQAAEFAARSESGYGWSGSRQQASLRESILAALDPVLARMQQEIETLRQERDSVRRFVENWCAIRNVTPSDTARALRGDFALLEACAPAYLNDGETPAGCLERNRKDIDALLTLLAAEKARNEEAESRGADRVLREIHAHLGEQMGFWLRESAASRDSGWKDICFGHRAQIETTAKWLNAAFPREAARLTGEEQTRG